MAARRLLTLGGNAVDAACAAMLTACVVLPASTGLGGYGGSMVAYLAGRGVVALDFDSRAPLGYRDDLYVGKPDAAQHGYLAVSTPAVVAGIGTALREFGTRPFHDVALSALRHADAGFRMDAKQNKLLHELKAKTDATTMRALFPDGTIPATGQPWVQPDLAKLIRRLCDEGPAAMYEGEVARRIVKQVRENGGILSEDDFRTYKPTVVKPVSTTYRGLQFFTPPPPSGGITTLQILKALEQFDLASMEPWGAEYFHTVAEVTKAAWRDRERFLGDPDAVDVPMAEMLSDRRAKEIAAGVPAAHATVSRPAAGAAGGEHTVNICTADAFGNVCSLTATQGDLFGAGVAVEGLGLVLGHGMSRFEFGTKHPNAAAPGKRMHHNMSPAVVLAGDDKPRFVIGMPGGPKIVNVTAQIAVSLIDFGKTPAESVKSPRIHTTGGEPLTVNAAVDRPVVAGLQAMGHAVKKVKGMGGPANAISIDPATGKMIAASEAGPRSTIAC